MVPLLDGEGGGLAVKQEPRQSPSADPAHNWYRAGWVDGVQFGICVGALIVALILRLS